MIVTELPSKLAAFAEKFPTTRLVITNGRDDVYEGNYDPARAANAFNPRENVVVLYAMTAFFALHFVKGVLVDCWRSPNGEWIGVELGLEGRNVFGSLPVATPQPASRPVPRVVAPIAAGKSASEILAEAARSGNMAAAITGGSE